VKDARSRFPTARLMAQEIESVMGVASPVEVGDFVAHLAGDTLRQRSRRIAEIESSSSSLRSPGPAALVEELARASAPSVPPYRASDPPKAGEARSERSAASKVSHTLSVPSPPSRPRRWPLAFVATLVVGTGLAVAFVAFVPGRHETSTATPSEPSSTPPAASASAAASGTNAPTTPTVEATPPPTGSVAATPPPTGNGATASVAEAPSPTPRPPQAQPQPASQKASTKPKCDRPYTVDSAGHMHFRAECL